jgi:hypothetical protein
MEASAITSRSRPAAESTSTAHFKAKSRSEGSSTGRCSAPPVDAAPKTFSRSTRVSVGRGVEVAGQLHRRAAMACQLTPAGNSAALMLVLCCPTTIAFQVTRLSARNTDDAWEPAALEDVSE